MPPILSKVQKEGRDWEEPFVFFGDTNSLWLPLQDVHSPQVPAEIRAEVEWSLLSDLVRADQHASEMIAEVSLGYNRCNTVGWQGGHEHADL